MSARTISSLTDEGRDLRKQIGCMNGIFHHFLTGRRSTTHRHKRLIQGGQYQQDGRSAKPGMERGLEMQKEKPRTSTESSRASYSSSTCSTSTFSSMDCNLPLKQINNHESTFWITKEQQPSSVKTKSMQALDLRDVVKDSVYRDVIGLSVKSRDSKERKGKVMKHIDSPRPSLQLDLEKPKPTTLPRYSYDGRESQENGKWAGKHKEHPRLSLDSKTSSMKYSALESRSNFLVHDQNMEPGNQHRRSSVVAKLMGLEALPDENSTPTLQSCPKQDFLSQVTYSPRVSQTNPTSPSLRKSDTNSVRKPRLLQMASQDRKAPTDSPSLSSSVYGEIEKRIAELEFKRSGKDLRALKQILEAMEKSRERLENQRGESAEVTLQRTRCVEGSSTDQSRKDGKTNDQVLIKASRTQRQLGSPVVIMKPTKVTDKGNISYSTRICTEEMPQLRRLQTQEPKHRQNAAHRQKAKDLSPKNNLKDSSRHSPSIHGRSSGTTSPRLQQNLLRTGLSRPTTSASDSGDAKKGRSKKMIEKGSQNRKTRVVKAKDLQLSDDQFSELSSETRYSSFQGDTASVKSESNNSLVSMTETEIININAAQKKNYMSRTRKHMPAVDSIVATVEQPSPISVLDDAFYCEDSPSPVKKTSTAFRDKISSPSEEEWHLEDQKHLTEFGRSDHGRNYNEKLEDMKHPIQELSSLHNEPDETSVNHDALLCGGHNPNHIYINKVLLTSGLLKDSSFISATDRLISSYHLINPDMFHVIEQTEDINRNEKMNSDKKLQRKIIFDIVDEILVRKITSGRFAVGKKTSPQALLKEIYAEIDHASQFSNCNFDSTEDEITWLLTSDMKYQSEDWADYKCAVPALVLDIERLIFKDLINEVVTGEVMEAHDWPKRHHRRLFRK